MGPDQATDCYFESEPKIVGGNTFEAVGRELGDGAFDEAIAWWRNVLLADMRHQSDFLCFGSHDDVHPRLAVVKVAELRCVQRGMSVILGGEFVYIDGERVVGLGFKPGTTLSLASTRGPCSHDR